MTLDVVVTDRSGKPATGLLQRDFTLLDNKRPQNILSFREVDGGAAAADLPVEVILIVDEINTEFTNVTRERVEVEKFLRQNGGVLAQPTSVIFFSDKEATGTSSSRDGNAVIQELSGKLSGLRTVGRAQSTYGNNERMQFSLNALKRLSDYEAGTTGRKLVVWISPGWPFFTAAVDQDLATQRQKQALFNSVVTLWDAMRRARITLYQIDPLGTSDAGQARTSDYVQFLKPLKNAGQAANGPLSLQVLATQSGGRVFNSANDVAGEIAACAADANSFYSLTFEGLPGDGPNEYHALDIKMGRPGLTVRTRYGYYAQPAPRAQ
jgi:VWFA-related protein